MDSNAERTGWRASSSTMPNSFPAASSVFARATSSWGTVTSQRTRPLRSTLIRGDADPAAALNEAASDSESATVDSPEIPMVVVPSFVLVRIGIAIG